MRLSIIVDDLTPPVVRRLFLLASDGLLYREAASHMRSGDPGSRSKVDWYYRPTWGCIHYKRPGLARALTELKVAIEMALIHGVVL